MVMNDINITKMLAAGIKAMVADGKDGESLAVHANRSPTTHQLLVDIGILATKSYDSEWLQSQQGWLKVYNESN